MIWWLQLIIIWLSIDIVIIATGWYMVTLKQYFPDWWEQVIACEAESDFELEPVVIEILAFNIEPETAE